MKIFVKKRMSVMNDTRIANWMRSVWLVFLSVTLAACLGEAHDDLRDYIQQVKAKPAGRIAPVPEFKSYETFEYIGKDTRDPFSNIAMETAVVDGEAAGLRPNIDRNKEALEEYPLDTLKFVGHLERKDEKWAIITSPDHLVHKVKVGNHLGSNYGEIVSISETEIGIKEIIEDGLGGWIEREAMLSLKE